MYRTADTSLWDDPKVRSLSKDGKLLFVYLFTNRLTHVSGIYVIPPSCIVHDTGLDLEEVKLAMHELGQTVDMHGEKAPLVYWDAERYVTWVVKMFKHQGRGEKNLRSAAAHLCNLHSSPLIDLFLERYPEVDDYLIRNNGTTMFSGTSLYKTTSVTTDGGAPVTVEEILQMWNTIPGVKQCEQVGDSIKKRIAAARRKHLERTWWENYCKRVARSDFLCGRATPKTGASPFVATLFWATGPVNMDRIMAGDFENKKGGGASWRKT